MKIDQLNEEQLLAVKHKMDHPAAVIAGAGSGKTRVLTFRMHHLIHNEHIPGKKITAITFTNRAAGEIQERLQLAEEEHLPRIGTIHGLALSAIRRAPKGFGLLDRVSPLDEYDQKCLLSDIVEKKGLIETVKPWLVQDKLEYHRARGVGFAIDYTADVHAQAQQAHAGYHALSSEELDVWAQFEIEKRNQSVVDFDDMLHLVVRRGKTDDKWLTSLQKQFQYVLMDEGQDTNVIQWAFVNMLLPQGNNNIFVVGDISQSIYGFSGAAPEILLNYTKEWRGLEPTLYKLEQNYRSVPEVVKMANKIQKFMTDTVPLRMDSARGKMGHKGNILLRRSGTTRELAASIADDIWCNNQEKTCLYRETAILVRAGSQVRDLETSLVKNRIPYIVRGAMSLLQTEEVRDVLSYLRIASNPNDFMALCRSVCLPKRGIGDKALDKIKVIADEKFEGDLVQAAISYNHMKLPGYIDIVQNVVKRKENPLDAIEYILRATKYLEFVKDKYKKHPKKVQLKTENLDRLKEVILNLMSERELTVDDVVFQLTMADQKDAPSASGKVIVSTIHSAKGLEWKHVYVVGLYEGSLPHKWSKSDNEIEEERRVFYVSCTRAKDLLVLGVPGMLELPGRGSQFVAPSRFLTELGIC
jgi:DNA helicase-2/ATP-dependent DNA helicase PcrA